MIKRMMNLWRKWCAMRHHRHEQMENRQAIETPVEIAIETSEKTTASALTVYVGQTSSKAAGAAISKRENFI